MMCPVSDTCHVRHRQQHVSYLYFSIENWCLYPCFIGKNISFNSCPTNQASIPLNNNGAVPPF